MASTWRVLFPNGRDEDASATVEVKLSEAASVEVVGEEGGYRIRNCGKATVMIVCDGEEAVLDFEGIREGTRECAFYLLDQKESTLHRVVSSLEGCLFSCFCCVHLTGAVGVDAGWPL